MFEDFTEYSDFEPAGLELPKIEITDKMLSDLDLENNATSLDVLKSLARKGIKEKGIDKFENKKEYFDRAEREIEVYDRLGFIDYILLNWDVINYGKSSGYAIGAGRGSAPGSLINYLLGITDIDPIPANLYFERFVSETRSQKIVDKSGKEFLVGSLAPDIDTDVSNDDRASLVEYIESKHSGKTAKILTFNTFTSKLCIKETAKFFGKYSEEQATRISDMIPKEHGRVLSLKEAKEQSEPFKKWAKSNPDIYDGAVLIENLNKNTSVHAAGIAICSKDIKDVCPLQLTKDGDLISGYDMDDVADLMVKFDILGLRTLSIAHRTCKKIGINMSDIDPEDEFIYERLRHFEQPCGLFQISADTNAEVVKKVKPESLEELSDAVALARPGALAFVDDYVRNKNFPEELGLDKNLDKILATSKNVLLYQEQMMRACSEVFGMSLLEGEELRKVVGKKKLEEIPKWKGKIFDAAEKKGLDKKVAEYFWKVVEASGSYLFNLSHSRAYAVLAAKTAWLKYKYPKEFFTSILELAEEAQDPMKKVAEVNRELPYFGILLLPPSLENASMDFKIEGDGIRYGLKSVKGVSDKAKTALEEFAKREAKNKYDVFIFAKECGMSINVLTSLIYAGALGQENIAKKVLEAQAFNLLTDREKRNLYILGPEYEYDLLNSIKDCVDRQRIGDDNKPIIKEGRFETFKKKFADYKKIYIENKKKSKLSTWWFETNLLGYSPSLKLRDCFDYYGDLELLKDAKNSDDRFRAVGRVDDFFIKLNADNVRFINMEISDDTDKINLIFGDWRSSKCSKFLDNNELKKEDIVVFKASKSKNGDIFFADDFAIVDAKIITKKSQL